MNQNSKSLADTIIDELIMADPDADIEEIKATVRLVLENEDKGLNQPILDDQKELNGQVLKALEATRRYLAYLLYNETFPIYRVKLIRMLDKLLTIDQITKHHAATYLEALKDGSNRIPLKTEDYRRRLMNTLLRMTQK